MWSKLLLGWIVILLWLIVLSISLYHIITMHALLNYYCGGCWGYFGVFIIKLLHTEFPPKILSFIKHSFISSCIMALLRSILSAFSSPVSRTFIISHWQDKIFFSKLDFSEWCFIRIHRFITIINRSIITYTVSRNFARSRS